MNRKHLSMKTKFEYFVIFLTCSFRSILSSQKLEDNSARLHHQILEDLKYYKDRSDYWRKQAGTSSCKENGLGPTGGFCLDPATKESVGGNHAFDKGIAEEMSRLMLGSKSSKVSVVDFGCGLGLYGQYFKASSKRIVWTGYDGSENIENVTSGFVKFIDLAEPKLLVGTNYDWSMSIEVAEHLPMHLESNFLYMLHVHNKMGIFLTWAIPGQGGHHHVNCQSNSYVKCVMTKLLNYTAVEKVTAKLKSVATLQWLKNTSMVFFKAKDYTPTPWHIAARKILSKYAMGSTELEDMHAKALHDSGCWTLRNLKGT